MRNSNRYVTVASYFTDLKIIDDRLSRLEKLVDNITKSQVEMLEEKKDGTNKNSTLRPKKSN